MSQRQAASIASDEIDQFSRHAGDWWNPEGPFQPLHRLNPVRLRYMRDKICGHFGCEGEGRDVLRGLDILDVGCGGGLLTEPLARLGGQVTGLDGSKEAIIVAQDHAQEMGLKINYVADSVESLAEGKKRFDVITALEIAEHVADLDSFFEAIATLLKPNGILILSTLNRTAKSFMLGIVAAEYLLKWVPRGTHQWKKFIRPSELVARLETNGLRASDLTGMVFNPLNGEFELRKADVGVNYLMSAVRH
jgi:2-polyprenyl-6-hydroxyphenyl methylase / 3-demethylubiquinone-9 3-methyltransferase